MTHKDSKSIYMGTHLYLNYDLFHILYPSIDFSPKSLEAYVFHNQYSEFYLSTKDPQFVTSQNVLTLHI